MSSHPFYFFVSSHYELEDKIHTSSKLIFGSHISIVVVVVVVFYDLFRPKQNIYPNDLKPFVVSVHQTLSYLNRNISIAFPNPVVKRIILRGVMIRVSFQHVSIMNQVVPMNIGIFISILRLMGIPKHPFLKKNDWHTYDCMKIVMSWVHPSDPIRTLVLNGQNGMVVIFIRLRKHVIDAAYYLSLTRLGWDVVRR